MYVFIYFCFAEYTEEYFTNTTAVGIIVGGNQTVF